MSIFLSSVLPHLEPGTLVHIHDMLLPDDYPTEWAGAAIRAVGYRALLGSGAWQPLFSSHWAVTRNGVSGGEIRDRRLAAAARGSRNRALARTARPRSATYI